MTGKRTRYPGSNRTPSTTPDDLSLLETRVPAALLRLVRMHAALDAKSLDDFVREAVQQSLARERGESGPG